MLRQELKWLITLIWLFMRKTWHMWITQRAHPFYMFAWCISFLFSIGSYFNPLQYNVCVTYDFVKIQFDCMRGTWDSPHIVVTNIIHSDCTYIVTWVVKLIYNHKICSFHKFNILKGDLPCIPLTSLI